ncbi:11939_t:CDS:2, partial [Gigaspora rosea]
EENSEPSYLDIILNGLITPNNEMREYLESQRGYQKEINTYSEKRILIELIIKLGFLKVKDFSNASRLITNLIEQLEDKKNSYSN